MMITQSFADATFPRLSRRHFCLTTGAAAVAAFAMPAWPTMRQEETLKLQPLRDDVWAILGGGGNSLFIKSADGPIVIDTKVGPMGRPFADVVRTLTADTGLTGAPLTIINTHHHGDHIGGNFAFTGTSAHPTIVGHRNLTPRVADTVDSRIRPAMLGEARGLSNNADRATLINDIETWTDRRFAPTTTYETRLSLDRDDLHIDLHHICNGHTDNDSVVHLTKQNVVHLGDLLFNELHPFIDRPAGANTVSWSTFLERAMDLCDDQTIVVPGHGDITDRTAIPKMVEYFRQLRDVVATERARGASRDAVTELMPACFAGRGFEQLQPRCLGAMYDELDAEADS
ncbi:MAG: MBL fold metallo-hydrolase [Phycisphaerales bacterium]|nr:MBL fold metallo-hydrolase [Phycisphaerales bacterium]